MATRDEIAATAREAADSVFRFVDRTAEPTPEGVRWQTLDYHNAPHYDANVFNGVAGIPLFLTDYYRITGTARALEHARGGAEWCSTPDRSFAGDNPRGWPASESLCLGRAGVALAWLRLAQVTGDTGSLQRATAIAERLLAAEPGPVTDFLGGAAGEGIFLVRMWEVTRARFGRQRRTVHRAVPADSRPAVDRSGIRLRQAGAHIPGCGTERRDVAGR